MTTAALVKFGTGTAPGAPGTGFVSLYAKSDSRLYYKTATGLEIGPLGIASGLLSRVLAGIVVVVPANYQYLLLSNIIIDPGGDVIVDPDGDLAVVPTP